MRWIACLLVWFSLMPVAAIAAEIEVHVRTGPARLSAGANGLRAGIRPGDRAGRHMRRHDERNGHTRRDRHRHRHRDRGHRPIIVVPVRERAAEIREKPPVPTEPAAPAITEPPVAKLPLDPLGQSRRLRARTAPNVKKPWTIGEPLPASLPHVTLAPGPYGLPDLPPGEIYARVAGDLLRINAATRRVVAEVDR